MRGNKSKDMIGEDFKVLSDWPWVYKNYEFVVDYPISEIDEISIDPSTRMADINSKDNIWVKSTQNETPLIIYKNTN